MKQMDADHEPGWLKDALLREPPSQHDKKTSASKCVIMYRYIIQPDDAVSGLRLRVLFSSKT